MCDLGDKTFFMGDEPCEVDCVLFGMIAMILYNMPGSKHQKFVRGEYINNIKYQEYRGRGGGIVVVFTSTYVIRGARVAQ